MRIDIFDSLGAGLRQPMIPARGREPWFRLAIAGLVALSVTSGALLALRLPVRASPPAQQIYQQGPTCTAPCVTAAGSRAHPELLLAGETTTVTVHSEMVCAGLAAPFHVTFVVVQSEGIGDQELQDIKSNLTRLLQQMDLPDAHETRVSLIEAKHDVRTLVPWTDAPTHVQRGIGRLSVGGDHDIAAALEEGGRQLRRARIAECPRPAPIEIIILFAAEPEDGRCPQAERAAGPIKGQGTLVATICAGRDCYPTRCLRAVASSARYAFGMEPTGGLWRLLGRIRDGAFFSPRLRAIEVVEHLAPGSDYVVGSASPPARWNPDERSLSWYLTAFPKDGVTVTWRARPTAPGLQNPSQGAELRWSFDGFDPVTRTVEAAWVQVFGPPRDPR